MFWLLCWFFFDMIFWHGRKLSNSPVLHENEVCLKVEQNTSNVMLLMKEQKDAVVWLCFVWLLCRHLSVTASGRMTKLITQKRTSTDRGTFGQIFRSKTCGFSFVSPNWRETLELYFGVTLGQRKFSFLLSSFFKKGFKKWMVYFHNSKCNQQIQKKLKIGLSSMFKRIFFWHWNLIELNSKGFFAFLFQSNPFEIFHNPSIDTF